MPYVGSEKDKADRRAAAVRWRNRHPEQRMVEDARRRARERGIPCTISRHDVVIPSHCPVLGIPLVRKQGKPVDGSPSLDRVHNTEGYTPNNIAVISMKANRIKNNATLDELKAVVNYMEDHNAP